MDNRKFEKLIDLIINENEEQARALFHDIVVEKSREIYENMMDDDMGMKHTFTILDDTLIDQIAAMDGAEVDPDTGTVETHDENTARQLAAFAKKNPQRLKSTHMGMKHTFTILDDTLIDKIASMDGAEVDPDTGTVETHDENTARQLAAFAKKNPQRLKSTDSMMEDDMDMGMANDGQKLGGQVGEMMHEIGVEEEGMSEDEEDLEFDDMDDGEDEMMDIDMDDEGEDEDEDLEDRVVDLEDKLDQLMAEFEEIMGDEEGEEGEEEEEEGEEEEAMMEAIQLQQMKGLYGSKIGGDNGSQPKSTYADNSGQAGMASRPVKFSGSTESMPTGPKGPSNAYSKGESQVKDANNWKNAPAQRKQDLTAAPKPTTTQAAGTNTKSPVAESRKRK